jgi:hypothetical protein
MPPAYASPWRLTLPFLPVPGSSVYNREVDVRKTLEEALQELRQEPGRPVRARVEGMVVEVRVVPEVAAGRSAADAFAEVGPWQGETTEEIMAILAEARREGSSRGVPKL